MSEWETRAQTSTRLEFDSTRTRPAAYSSISHGTRVVRRVTLRFVSSDYFRHNSVRGERRNKMHPREPTPINPRVCLASHGDWKHYPHYCEINHETFFRSLTRQLRSSSSYFAYSKKSRQFTSNVIFSLKLAFLFYPSHYYIICHKKDKLKRDTLQ